MRRTLAVLVTTAALLVPATAASAAPPGGFSNASCNSAGGGNYGRTGHGVKESDRDPDCRSKPVSGGTVSDPLPPSDGGSGGE